MVAHLGLRSHEILYGDWAIFLTKFYQPQGRECHEEVANHSQRIFTFQNNNLLVFLTLMA